MRQKQPDYWLETWPEPSRRPTLLLRGQTVWMTHPPSPYTAKGSSGTRLSHRRLGRRSRPERVVNDCRPIGRSQVSVGIPSVSVEGVVEQIAVAVVAGPVPSALVLIVRCGRVARLPGNAWVPHFSCLLREVGPNHDHNSFPWTH